MTARLVSVMVHRSEGTQHSGLAKFIDELRAVSDSVPEQYRHTLTIEFDAYTEWDSATMDMTIRYERPENEEERKRRETQEKARAAAMTVRELATPRELQKKYGGNP